MRRSLIPLLPVLALLAVACGRAVRAQAACTAVFPSTQSEVQIGSGRCFTLTNGQATTLSANTSVTGDARGVLQLQQELVYALNVSSPWVVRFANVSFLGAAVWPAPDTSSTSRMPDALFLPAALDLRAGGSINLVDCTIVTACSSVNAWATALSRAAANASSLRSADWTYRQLNASAILFTSASSARVSVSNTLLTCNPASLANSVTLNAAVNSPQQLAEALPGLNSFRSSTAVAISTDTMELPPDWQAPSFSSNLTLFGPGSSQPAWDLGLAPVVFTLAAGRQPVLALTNVQLSNSCYTCNLSYPMPSRLVPLSFTMGGVVATNSAGGAVQPLSSQSVSITNSTLYVTTDEMRVVLYSSAVMSASPMFARLPILASFMQQLPVQDVSIASVTGGTPSQQLSVVVNSFSTTTLSFSNVTLAYAPPPDRSRYLQCVTNVSVYLGRSTELYPLNVYLARDSSSLGQALTEITASGIATGSSYPPLLLLTTSAPLLPSRASSYTTQRDVLISGPLEGAAATQNTSRAFGSPSSVTLDLSNIAGSVNIAAASAKVFIQRLVLINPVISQINTGGDTSAVQRSALPLWAFSTPDGSARPSNPFLQLYMCTLILIPVDFLQLYNMAVRGSDWKTATATNVLVQNTEVFQVASFDACGINLTQYTGFGLNATNLLLQPDNCDATKALINTGSSTPPVTPWPPPPVPSPEGISTGAQIGIGVGVAAGVLLLATAGFVFCKLRRRPTTVAGPAGVKGADAMEAGVVDQPREGSHFARSSHKDDPLSMWRNLYEGGLREDSQLPSNSIDNRGASPMTSADRDVGDSRGSAGVVAVAAVAGGVPIDASARGAVRRRASDGVVGSSSNANAASGAAAEGAAAVVVPEPQPASWDPHKEVANIASNLADEANKLVLLEPIGQGGFGTVYRGRWRNLEVAVKTVLFSEATKSGGDAKTNKRQSAHPQQRAILEAAVCTSVMHPNLVTTYHYDITPVNGGGAETKGISGLTIDQGRNTDWKLYLVQEYCNASLQDALRNRLLHKPETKTPDMDLVLTVLMDIARGLIYIHGKNIIHGDLTPGNVLLKQDTSSPIGVVGKITDFGLCTTIDPNMTHISNVTNGTPYYVAPEVVAAGTLTKKSDVYSFGVLMWELYRCMPPWVKTETGYALNKRFRRFPLDTPRVYVSLCARCLDKSPKERPTFDEVLGALEAMHAAYLMGYDSLAQPRPGSNGEEGAPLDPSLASTAAPTTAPGTAPGTGPGTPQVTPPEPQFARESSSSGIMAAAARNPGATRSPEAGATLGRMEGGPRNDPPPRSTALAQYFHSQALQKGSEEDEEGGGGSEAKTLQQQQPSDTPSRVAAAVAAAAASAARA